MAEDNGKEEEKFDFTAEGEGYISLDEARVLAVRTAVDSPGNYGRNFRRVTMVFEVVESTETEDHYIVTLSFRPQGNFDGTPGQEQFVVGKDGTIAVRQVLSTPIQTSASPAGTASKGGGFPILPVAIGVVVVGAIAAVGAVVVLMSSGGDGVPMAAVPSTESPVPTQPPAPVAIPADTPEPTVNIDATVEAGIQQGLAERPTSVPTSVPVPTATYTPIPPTKRPTPTKTPTPTATPRPTPDTRTARIVFNRAEITLQVGHYQGAIREYTTAIELNPDYAAAYSGRALAYLSLGQSTLADADKAKACSLDSQFC